MKLFPEKSFQQDKRSALSRLHVLTDNAVAATKLMDAHPWKDQARRDAWEGRQTAHRRSGRDSKSEAKENAEAIEPEGVYSLKHHPLLAVNWLNTGYPGPTV